MNRLGLLLFRVLPAGLTLALLTIEAEAARLSISPVRLYLTPQNDRGVIRIHNPEQTPLLIQVQGFGWSQDGGEDELQPSTELIVVPPVVTLAPDGEQIVRVGFREAPSTDTELSYRILVTEVPDQTEEAGQIGIALQLSLPVFFSPPNTAPIAVWSARLSEPGQLAVSLQNQGSSHIQVTKLAVYLSPDDAEPLTELALVGYALPHSTMSWNLAFSSESILSRLDSVVLKAETNHGELQEALALSP